MVVDRTPMNAICGMTKVLKESPLAQEQRECVRIISSSAKALLSLLNNILDFSKIEAGKTEILVRRHRRPSLVSHAVWTMNLPLILST
jgi:signal transduction histidine kinase